jgi:hypothetical protein
MYQSRDGRITVAATMRPGTSRAILKQNGMQEPENRSAATLSPLQMNLAAALRACLNFRPFSLPADRSTN